MNIHERIMVVINTDSHDNCNMIVSERGQDGQFVVCNEIFDEDAITLYKQLMGMEDVK